MAGIGRRLKHDLDDPAYLGFVRKLDPEIVAAAASTTRFIESFLSDVEGLQMRDQYVKKWVEIVKDAYYDLIDAFEELNLQEAKIKSRLLGHPLPFYDLRAGLHKARGIINQLHVLVPTAKNLGLTPERIRARLPTTSLPNAATIRDRALPGLVSRLIDCFLYSEHEIDEELVRRVGRGMLIETLAAAFEVMHVIGNAGILQVSDQGVKEEWVESAERILHNAMGAFVEVKQEAKKARLLPYPLSSCNPNMGRHKIRGIVNQLVVLAASAKMLVLSPGRTRATLPTTSLSNIAETIHGQDEERTTLAALVFRLIDNFLNPENEDSVQKMDTSMLREILHVAVLIIYNAESLQVSDERAKDILHNLIKAFEEVKQEAKKARLLAHLPSLCNLHGGRHKMEGIFWQVRDLTRAAYRLGLALEPIPEENSEVRATPPTTFSTYEATIYGRDEEKNTLIGKLFNNYISTAIVGGAGIGKSALAHLGYDNPRTTSYYDCRAWVFVPKEFSSTDIAKAILNSLTSDPVIEAEEEALMLRLRRTVEGKRCLFVLDDVWNLDSHKWTDLKWTLNQWARDLKILITTRNEEVARREYKESEIIHLSGLSEEACWSIIKDSAFGTPVDDEPQIEKIFKEVGKDIAKKCNGVPLIAKSLGGIMRNNKSIQKWQQVLESDVWDIEGMTDVRSSLTLSYSMMSPKLRQCLLYCAIFPKNHSIDVGKLIKLWIAQDFVTSDQDEMERGGWEYVKQLLDRSIFQEFKQDGNGNFQCKLEGGMRDLIQFLAENECHIMLLDHEKAPKDNQAPKSRHCTLNIACQTSLPESIACAEKLHTLMILSEYSSADPTNLAGLLGHMRRVRALDLSSCSIKELPLKVGELLHLRYLDLSFNHNLKKLPQAICNLLNLQTLNLNGCGSLQKLPKGIGKLMKLRHLEILWTTSLSYLPKGIANLISLRTLSRFFGNSLADGRACNLGHLQNLNYIQGCITIDGLGGETDVSDAAKAGLNNKKDLLGLELWFSAVGSGSNDEGVLEALKAPPGLEGLGIFYYRGESFPNWMTALENLKHLMLSDCSKCSILPPLTKLSSLESLKIKNMSSVKIVGSEFLGIVSNNADDGEEGSSSMVAFPKLQNLCFQKLDDWEEWTGINGKGGYANIMPSLSSLSIVECPKLRAVPDYIEVKKKLSRDIRK